MRTSSVQLFLLGSGRFCCELVFVEDDLRPGSGLVSRLQQLNKPAECVCLHDWPTSKASEEGEAFNGTHISGVFAPGTIVVVYLQLFMEKHGDKYFFPHLFMLCWHLVWSDMQAISIKI